MDEHMVTLDLRGRDLLWCQTAPGLLWLAQKRLPRARWHGMLARPGGHGQQSTPHCPRQVSRTSREGKFLHHITDRLLLILSIGRFAPHTSIKCVTTVIPQSRRGGPEAGCGIF